MPISRAGLFAFHAVAQAQSFTRAAKAQHVSQPTLSAQVRSLEETYGVRLFDRVGRQVRLTPLGQSLYVITSRMFGAQDEAQALLEGTRGATRGHLRIAADSAGLVMPILARMRQSSPALTFSISIGNSTDVIARVMAFEADVAITARSSSDPKLHSVQLRSDRLVGFVGVGHPLAAHQAIPIEAFAGQDLVLRERGSITREAFESRLFELGIRPASLLEVQTREAVRDAVAAGFGVGVIFSAELREDETVRRLEITGADLDVAEFAACRAERRTLPLVRSFFEAARQLGDGAPPAKRAG